MDKQLSLFATQPQWVDAKASKPRTGKEVLAYVKYLYHGSGYGNGYGYGYGNGYGNLFTVTHWCYLPEPPKE